MRGKGDMQLHGCGCNPGIGERDWPALFLTAALDPCPHASSLSVGGQKSEAREKAAHQVAPAGAPILCLHAVLDFGQGDQRNCQGLAGKDGLIRGSKGMVLEQEGNDIGIHNGGCCGVHQRVTGRESALRSARIKATNSSAPSGSISVSAFRSSTLTGGLRTTPARSRTSPPRVSVPSILCGISIPSLAQQP